jgi:hypothetical protein
MKISLIVTDASPLITLAVAGELDALLVPGIQVIVPDMVRFEVIRHANKPGSQEILDWLRLHEKKVLIGSTEVWEEYEQLLLINPLAKSRSRGEEAAGEILNHELSSGVDAAILLFEDSDVKKTNFLIRMPDNVLVMSTSTFLRGLQKSGFIPDANTILQKAVAIRSESVLKDHIHATNGAENLVQT